MTDSTIDEHYEAARKAGAIGGKLIGRGRRSIFHVLHAATREAARDRSDGGARFAAAEVSVRR
jgi:galactokinase/mevalonate kinase-like predicted kinase